MTELQRRRSELRFITKTAKEMARRMGGVFTPDPKKSAAYIRAGEKS